MTAATRPAVSYHPRTSCRPIEACVRPLLIACLLALVLLPAALAAAPAAPAASAVPAARGTGDAWIDQVLLDIDRYGVRYPDAFADELARYHQAPRALVIGLLAEPRWTPGAAYFACLLAEAAGEPCRTVVQAHAQGFDADWSAIEQRLRVPPGSAAFAQLRERIPQSYARWGRPLPAVAATPGARPRQP